MRQCRWCLWALTAVRQFGLLPALAAILPNLVIEHGSSALDICFNTLVGTAPSALPPPAGRPRLANSSWFQLTGNCWCFCCCLFHPMTAPAVLTTLQLYNFADLPHRYMLLLQAVLFLLDADNLIFAQFLAEGTRARSANATTAHTPPPFHSIRLETLPLCTPCVSPRHLTTSPVLRLRIEETGRIELSLADARLVGSTRQIHAVLLPLAIIVAVWSAPGLAASDLQLAGALG